MNDDSLPVVWGVQRGFEEKCRGTDGAQAITENELALLRGKVFFQSGRRPPFRKPDGTYSDNDEFDALAHHVFGRNIDGPVVCCRLLGLRDSTTSTFEAHLPPGLFEELLAERKVKRDRVAEASRWVVAKHRRSGRLGARAASAMWALAQHLEIGWAIAWAGTRNGQANALIKMGAKPIERVPLLSSEEWDDELQALEFDVYNPSPIIAPLVKDMAKRLQL